MSKSGKISVALGILLLAGLFVYFGFFEKQPDTASGQPTIKVGALLSLTGGFANYGEDMRNALELARQDIERKDNIKIDLIVEDAASDSKTALQGANKLINIDRVPLVIGGPGSTFNLAVAPVMEQNKTYFLVVSSAPKLNDAGDYIFKFHPDIDGEDRRITSLMSARKVGKAAVIYDQGSETITLGKDKFVGGAPAAGIQVTGAEGFDSKATDFKTILAKLNTGGPDALYILANDQSAGLIAKQTRELGLKQQFFAWSADESAVFLKVAGPAAEGTIITAQPFSCTGTEAVMLDFCKDYSAMFNNRIPLNYGAHAYDILHMVAQVVKEKGLDQLAQGLIGMNYHGVSGDIKLDDQGNVRDKDFVFRVVKDGKFVPLEQ